MIYKINEYTMAIINLGPNKCQVYEEKKVQQYECNATQIIKENCYFYGSSLSGRISGTNKMIGIRYKAPIILSESNSYIFFPTESIRKENCSWYNINHVKNYTKINRKLRVIFLNNQMITISTSYSIFNNQYLRSALLQNTLINRKNM